MSNISFAPISEYCEILGGFAFKSENLGNQGIPVIKIANITDDFRVEISSTQQYFPEEMFTKKHEKYMLKNRDIVIAMTGAKVGKIGRIRNNSEDFSLLNQRVAKISCDTIDPDYLWAAIRNPGYSRMFSDLAIGAAQPNMSAKQIGSIEVPIFPQFEEKRIGQISNLFDSLIETNFNSQETCQQMISTLFRSWFIDFDPVKDKAKGKNPYGMNDETAALFPDSFEDSKLGSIPTGWRILTLNEILDTIIDHRGLTPKKLGGDWAEEGYPAISAMNIKNGKIVKRQNIEYISEELYNKWMKVELKSGDILLTSEAPLGEIYYLFDDGKMVTSQRVFGIRSNPNLMPSIFLRYYLDSHFGQYELHARASGSTVSGIRQSELRKIKIITPPLEIMNYFSNKVKPLVANQNYSDNQIISLGQTRDRLISRLMSGKLSVS